MKIMDRVSHIVHINTLAWQIKGKKEDIENAQKDKTKRSFGVQFFLEDLRARTQHVSVSLSEELSLQGDEGTGTINIWFEKNINNFFTSILAGLDAEDFKTAFKKAYNSVASILSMLVFFYRRPLRIKTIEIYDKKYSLSYRTFNYAAETKKLILPKASLSKEIPIGSLLALYREGMNSVDLAYRYINFFKIYESWYNNDFAFKLTNNVLGKINISRLGFKITKKLLLSSYVPFYHDNFLNKSFKDEEVFKWLNYLRNLLAHYLIDRSGPPRFVNFDDIEMLEQIEAMSNLVERMATIILDYEFFLLSLCGDEFKNLYEIYQPVFKV